jgi:hypothetical protein
LSQKYFVIPTLKWNFFGSQRIGSLRSLLREGAAQIEGSKFWPLRRGLGMGTVVIPWKDLHTLGRGKSNSLRAESGVQFLAAAGTVGYEKGQIMQAAQPIIDILQDVAEPVAYGMMLWGFIKIIMNQQGEGLDIIKKAGWGYVFIQLLPWLFGIIKSIGKNAG